ncbi:BON domain protein [bacterium BMS3Bbin10]|nr:BON domain protein [bacterium BMS3Bbin10]
MFHCKPLKWFWGIPPVLLVIAFALYGVPLQIERDLSARTAAKLREAGHSWADARFNSRDAILEGLSFSRTELDQALDTVRAVWGVRMVEDRTKLIASPETYVWWAIKKERRLKIRGHAPTNKVRRTILGFVKAAMPDLEVDDKTVLAGGSPPPQVWLGSISFALVQLGHLRSGTIRLSGNRLEIAGEAETTESYKAVKTALTTQLPAGMKLASDKVTPPVVKPFSWRVKYLSGTISLDGYVPSEAAHSQILAQTRKLFPGAKVNDALELAVGAPDGWLSAVSASLIQLRRLESGRIRMKGARLEIEGIAADKETADDVAASVRQGLPSAYRSTEKINVRKKAKPADAPASGRSG